LFLSRHPERSEGSLYFVLDLALEEIQHYEMRSIKLVTTLGFFFVVAQMASADPLGKAALIGKWDCTSYTVLQKGKRSGTLQFKPHTMLFTYQEDGTWEMEASDATHTILNGSFEIHGSELIMKNTDGSAYQDWVVELKDEGKQMVLTDKRSVVTASKVETAP
jgi:hypothetical protein